MKTVFILALLFLNCKAWAANEGLRAFVEPADLEDNTAYGTNKDGFIYADQQFLVFKDRAGNELGKSVPAVWITKPGSKWRTYLISEEFGLIKSVDVKNGTLFVEFSFPHENRTKLYTIPLIVRDDIGLIFLDGIGLESQPLLSAASRKSP